MSARLAILCSGQGGQHAGMFDLARNDAAAARLLEACLPDWAAPADLFANRIAQPMIVAAACATWTALRPHLPAPVAVAGYSVGEVAALAVAGVVDAADAVALAQTRARLMDACVDAGRQGMLAVSGLPLARVEEILAAHATGGIDIAIVNGADQCILGGPSAASGAGPGLVHGSSTITGSSASLGLDQIATVFTLAGAQVTRLPVAIASHTRWMRAAVGPLQEAAMRLSARPPTARLLAGISGATSTTAAASISALIQQTVQTIRWDACMDALAEAGVTVALELGPGSALSRMLAARHPGIDCRAVADFRSLAGIAGWVARH